MVSPGESPVHGTVFPVDCPQPRPLLLWGWLKKAVNFTECHHLSSLVVNLELPPRQWHLADESQLKHRRRGSSQKDSIAHTSNCHRSDAVTKLTNTVNVWNLSSWAHYQFHCSFTGVTLLNVISTKVQQHCLYKHFQT